MQSKAFYRGSLTPCNLSNVNYHLEKKVSFFVISLEKPYGETMDCFRPLKMHYVIFSFANATV